MWKQVLLAASVAAAAEPIHVESAAVHTNSVPGQSFVSYSIELSSFPDFAGTPLVSTCVPSCPPTHKVLLGNISNPNTFTDNLLTNLGHILGSKPYIRVGGNTQDYALSTAPTTRNAPTTTQPPSTSARPFSSPTRPFPASSAVTAEGWQALVDTAPLACKALGRDRFYGYEYGNEPNNFNLGGKYAPRSTSWGPKDYVREWLNGTAEIRGQMRKHCPDLEPEYLEFMAPSYDDRVGSLKAVDNSDINTYSVHNYIDGATSPGVTLQHTLMNHTRTTRDVDEQLQQYKKIMATGKGRAPLIFGETNSLYFQGKRGLSNSFGAALWGLDFNLYSASAGYQRVHMHQGTNYRYQSWQPIDTEKTAKGTKAPYYGNIAAASALGNLVRNNVTIASLPLESDTEVAYAVYEGGSGLFGGAAEYRTLILMLDP
ncbi:hypothetical protein LLEC1_03298 [Akanthomyces lecanii]|uniref:Beta-glucuronidase C-terminal domain-containing protein n=1 Tax=Cordyceps confragosa TaxID=2714763 RepID=A0A179ICA7_CORDF|nr:hypothetical protein LLEC1_03298 [Akanthomyces lecanii]